MPALPRITVDLLPAPASGSVSLLVHGGAWDIPDEVLEDHARDLEAACDLGREALLRGTSALEAVVAVVAFMEQTGTFDAGRGSVLTLDGTVEMDAACMCGATLDVGSVIGIKHYPSPIQIAHALLDRGEGAVRILAGEGAERFAERVGFSRVESSFLVHPRERDRHAALLAERDFTPSDAFQPRPTGTVGCVARDRQGRLAAATSTGGTPLKPVGRVGDSPLPGSGLYACSEGAASCTGWGEGLATRVTALRGIMGLASETVEQAARQALTDLHGHVRDSRGQGGTGGIILLQPDGGGVAAFTTPRMARAGWSEKGASFLRVVQA